MALFEGWAEMVAKAIEMSAYQCTITPANNVTPFLTLVCEFYRDKYAVEFHKWVTATYPERKTYCYVERVHIYSLRRDE